MVDAHNSTRLGDLLVERKVITRAQLYQAIELQQIRRLHAFHSADFDANHVRHTELGEILIELDFIDRAQLKAGLGWQRRIRKATAAMVFIAPLLTVACGGGGGSSGGTGGGTNNPSNNAQTPTPSSQSISSAPVPEPVVDPPSSSVVSSVNVSSSSFTSVSPVALSSASLSSSSFSSSLLGGLPANSSSKNSSLESSRSSSSVAPVSSSSLWSSSLSSLSSSSSSSQVNGAVQIYWNAPTQRENGEYLDITEIGGYELRYKRKSDVYYTKIVIKDAYTDAYYFNNLQGEYEFQLAAFDTNGLYSNFIVVKPES